MIKAVLTLTGLLALPASTQMIAVESTVSPATMDIVGHRDARGLSISGGVTLAPLTEEGSA